MSSERHKLLGDFNRLKVSCLERCSLDPNTGFIFPCYPMFPPSAGLSFLGSPPLPTLPSVWSFLPREKCCLSISFHIPHDREAQSLGQLCVCLVETTIIFSPLLVFFFSRQEFCCFVTHPGVHLIPFFVLKCYSASVAVPTSLASVFRGVFNYGYTYMHYLCQIFISLVGLQLLSTFTKENELYHSLIVCPSQQLGGAGMWRVVSMHHIDTQLWALSWPRDPLGPVLLFQFHGT